MNIFVPREWPTTHRGCGTGRRCGASVPVRPLVLDIYSGASFWLRPTIVHPKLRSLGQLRGLWLGQGSLGSGIPYALGKPPSPPKKDDSDRGKASRPCLLTAEAF